MVIWSLERLEGEGTASEFRKDEKLCYGKNTAVYPTSEF
jgi:hypothetical protein